MKPVPTIGSLSHHHDRIRELLSARATRYSSVTTPIPTIITSTKAATTESIDTLDFWDWFWIIPFLLLMILAASTIRYLYTKNRKSIEDIEHCPKIVSQAHDREDQYINRLL